MHFSMLSRIFPLAAAILICFPRLAFAQPKIVDGNGSILGIYLDENFAIKEIDGGIYKFRVSQKGIYLGSALSYMFTTNNCTGKKYVMTYDSMVPEVLFHKHQILGPQIFVLIPKKPYSITTINSRQTYNDRDGKYYCEGYFATGRAGIAKLVDISDWGIDVPFSVKW